MTLMRSFLATVLAGAAVLAAGCGGSSSSSASASAESVALAPKDAAAWISIDTDQASGQWQGLEALLRKIPGAEKELDNPNSSPFAGSQLRRDVLPAVGKQLVLVVPAGSSDPIVLAKPDDRSKLDAILAKTKENEATAEVDGWTAVATTQKQLDTYKTALAKGTLADSDAFAAATEGLPDGALARGVVSGKGLSGLGGVTQGLTQAVPGVGAGGTVSAGVDRALAAGTGSIGTVGFAVTTSGGKLRFEATIDAPDGKAPAAYEPALLGKVPSSALLAFSFHGGEAVTGQLQGAAPADALKQVEKQLGVSLDGVAAALDGEGVLYIGAGQPIPEITLAIRPSDPASAKATLERIAASVGKQATSATPIPGLTLSLTTATVGDVVLVSTAKNAAETFDAGPKLTDTDRFKQAAGDVGLGDTTGGFVYVDVHGIGPLLQAALGSLGGSLGGSKDTTGGVGLGSLSAIDSVAVNTTVEGSRIHVTGVVRPA